VGIGPDQWTADAKLPQAVLHVRGAGVDGASDAPLLEIEATNHTAVIYLKNSGGASAGYIINSYNSIFVGSAPVATQDTHLQISKTTGHLIVGGPISDYTYPLTVGSITSNNTPATTAKPTVTRFYGCNSTASGANTGKTYLMITNNTANPQLGIVYDNNGVERWLSGTLFAAGPTSFFGWNYLSDLGSPDAATFDTTLKNNTVYISSQDLVSADITECQGGLNAANTPAAYGTAIGDGISAVFGSGQYNVASMSITGGTNNVITINFIKAIDNATVSASPLKGYTITAIGWDGTNSQVIVGKPTAKSSTHVELTFYPTDVDLEDAAVYWTWSILGGKHNP